MNCDGSSTASHSTPLMPLTLPSSTVKSGNRVFASPSFRIRTVSGGATLTGRLLQRTAEQDIRGAVTGSLTFELTIFDDFFTAMVGHRHIDPAATVTLLEGVRSAQSEPAGWNAVVLPALTKVNVERRTPTQLTVTLPRVPTYDISVPETVTVFLPPAAVSSGQRIVASPFFVIEADVGRAALRVLPDPRTAAVLPTTSATAATSPLSRASLPGPSPPPVEDAATGTALARGARHRTPARGPPTLRARRAPAR